MLPSTTSRGPARCRGGQAMVRDSRRGGNARARQSRKRQRRPMRAARHPVAECSAESPTHVKPFGELSPDALHRILYAAPASRRLRATGGLTRSGVPMRIPMLVGLAGLLMVTSAAAQDVSWDYAKGTDLARLESYAWTTGHPLADQMNHQRIVSAIEAQLAAKGFTKVDPADHPDALVAYYAGFERNLAVNEIGTGWGG